MREIRGIEGIRLKAKVERLKAKVERLKAKVERLKSKVKRLKSKSLLPYYPIPRIPQIIIVINFSLLILILINGYS